MKKLKPIRASHYHPLGNVPVEQTEKDRYDLVVITSAGQASDLQCSLNDNNDNLYTVLLLMHID